MDAVTSLILTVVGCAVPVVGWIVWVLVKDHRDHARYTV